MTVQTAATAKARALAQDSTSLLDAAYGCRAGGLDPVTCAPILLGQYPGTTAMQMAVAITLGWCGIISNTNLTSALNAANYSSSDVTAAVTATLQLTWETNATYTNSALPLMPKVHALYQGDLTLLTAGEVVDFLVVSALPGDYTPTPGTLIGALNNIGVSVQNLSQNPAATYPDYNCWVSQPISNQSFSQLIVFESTGQDAPTNIPGILSTLQAYWPNPHQGSEYPYVDIAQPLISTGSAGGNPTDVLTALFDSAEGVLSGTYNVGCVMTVIYDQSLVQQMTTLFNSLNS